MFYKMPVVFLNGKFVEENEAKVSINDSGYYYGDGFYEVILLYKGKMIDADLHLSRLMKNFETLHFKNYPSKNQIVDIINAVVGKNQAIHTAGIYLQFTRGETSRTHEFANLNLSPSILVKLNPCEIDEENIKTWNCTIMEDPRRMHCDIKMISLLPMVMAKYDAESNGFDDVIFYNSRCQSITEGSHFNVAIVDKNGTIITAPNGKELLPGCTKTRFIKIAKDNGYIVEERYFSKQELLQAKEVMALASLKPIRAITKIDNTTIGSGDVGDITKDLFYKFIDFIKQSANER